MCDPCTSTAVNKCSVTCQCCEKWARDSRGQFFSNALIVTGGKETQQDVWKYNGALDKWIQIESLSNGRWRHKMAVLGGKVYALGGFDGVHRLASVEAYDPFHNRWTQVNSAV